MKAAFSFLVAAACAAVSQAQQFDNPVGIPIRYYGSAIATTYATAANPCELSFGTEIGAASSAKETSATPQTVITSTAATANVNPGRVYQMFLYRANVSGATVYFQPINGCEIYLNGQKTNHFVPEQDGRFTLRVEKINDVTQSLAGKRGGECSSFPEDKPIWYVGLGSLRSGKFAGAVGFRAAAITSNLFTTSALVYDSVEPGEVSVTRDGVPGANFITDIAAGDVELHMRTISATSYKIEVCLRTTPTTPFITYTVSRYLDDNGIRIDKLEDGQTWSTVLRKTATGWVRYDWRKTLDTTSPTTTTVNGQTSTVTYGASDAGQIVKTKTFEAGELKSVALGTSTTAAPTTTYTYYTSFAGAGWPSAVESIVEPSGSWLKYDYFNGPTDSRAGLVKAIYSPWLDGPTTPASAAIDNCRMETFAYTANWDGAYTALASRDVTINGSPAGRTTWDYNWAYQTNVNGGHTIAQTVQKDYDASATPLTTTTLAYAANDAVTYYRGKLHSVTRPDGTKESYAYFNGTWNPSTQVFSAYSGAGARQTLIFHGQASASLGTGSGGQAVSSWVAGDRTWTIDTVYLVPNLSKITESVIDAHGRTVLRSEYVYVGPGNIERVAATAYTYNENNLLVTEKDLVRSVAAAGGNVSVDYHYTAGLLDQKTDVDGTKTVWKYSNLLRTEEMTTADGAIATSGYPAQTQKYGYFSSGLRKSVLAAGATVATTFTYETSKTGRLASMVEPKPGGGTLTTKYSYPSGVQTTTTLPTGATQTTTRFLDGRVKSETGTGQVNTSTTYSYDGTYFVTTSRNGSSTANGWVEETSDRLGRLITQRTPQVGWISGSTKVTRRTQIYAPGTGQLSRVTVTNEADGNLRLAPDHLYVYGNLGLLVKEGDDLNGNGSLDAKSRDRITSYASSFSKQTTGTTGWFWNETVQVLRTHDNDLDTTTVSRRKTRLTGFNGGAFYNDGTGNARVLSEVEDYDATNRRRTTRVWANAGARTKTQSVSFDSPAQAALTKWQDGYLQSEQSASGVLKTYRYNASGLTESVTEGSTNANISYEYFSNTRYPSKELRTIGSTGTASTTYTYSWNTTAKTTKIATTDAASNVAYTEYDPLGRVWRSWGTAAQPTLTTYDAYNRRTKLKTWQNPPADTFTGSAWPTTPPAGNEIVWTIDPATGLATRKTYPNTKFVSYDYNGRGQLKTRTWARGITTTYKYYGDSGVAGDPTGELQSVSYNDGITTGASYTYTRFGAPASIIDSAGERKFNYRADLQLNTETLGAFYGDRVITSTYDALARPTGYTFNSATAISATIGYDDATNRPNRSTGAFGATTVTFNLGYQAGTDWVSSVTSGGYTRSTPLTGRQGVIASATTKWTGATSTTTLAAFTAKYADPRGWRTGQDSGSSAGTAAGSWTKKLGLGDGVKAGTGSYDGFGQLTGTHAATESPTWMGTAGTIETLATRKLSWSYDLAGNRLTEGENGNVTAYSTTDANPNAFGSLNQYTTITGLRGESAIKYDLDGNLTQDGTWTYAYDGENRLKSATKTGQTLTFMYDHAGRRIAKTVNGVTTTFLWQGWQLAAELGSDGVSPQKTFVWGRDFSDAQGNAGGAGALLAQLNVGSISYAIPDAYGSIVGYLQDGALVAAVEFSPYGKGVTAFGTWQSHPIGYAGQYMDWETGLAYYGLRYYAPKHGRFLNRDPIEEAGGNNLYGFVGNAPTRSWDVLGLRRIILRIPVVIGRATADDWGTQTSDTTYYIDVILEVPDEAIVLDRYTVTESKHRGSDQLVDYRNERAGADINSAAAQAREQGEYVASNNAPGTESGSYPTGSKAIAGAIAAQTAADVSGAAGKTTVGSNLKTYPSGWRGNQYVTTIKISEVLAKVGLGLAVGATVWDWYHVTTGNVSVTHASVNTAVTVVGLRTGPMGASLAAGYVVVDNFYPGGWGGDESSQPYNGAGALRDIGTTIEQNQRVVPDWRMRDPGGF